MPKRARELGPLDIKRATHPGGTDRHHWLDVGVVAGLRLQITAAGTKSWVLRTTVGDRRRVIGLGAYPEVGLAEARDKAREAKRKVAAGIDPIEEKKAVRAALAAASARNLLFADAMDKWIAAKMSDRPEKSQKAIKSTITRYALPELGKLTVQSITVQDIVRALQEVWSEKPDTGQKLRSYLEGILSWATVGGHRSGDNPARWRGNLKELLPAPAQVEKGKTGNFPALAVADVPKWWTEVSKRDGMGALALRFAALCASRSGEVRGATWDEIDLDAAMWTIPASRMKAGAEHRVPLTAEAIALLKSVPRMQGVAFVFPSVTGVQMSDMSISAVMRRMQEDAEKTALEAGGDPAKSGWRDPRSGKAAVPHGLRSTFRDWAAERGYDRDMAEIALAHQVGSAVERAYRRTDMIERRRAMMQAWADFLHGRDAGVVVKFPVASA
ncbi:integrase arm-type DNA-binding domain-containing protein [Rhodobacter sp. SGA-6-6]|uniref:tyrosine-type recombinase/integrase n=1 Tax=Rhodobacter sp. SGA-6-6 TaxID=2710882 RepID=UPI0013EDF38F|nr:site-specific integrase [Rhodobacter sp. SGA-6-6]NGM46908.1 integrase arm-type DNA-binding domain-containing protein [Rhodobacter sp. SGA-6-6]